MTCQEPAAGKAAQPDECMAVLPMPVVDWTDVLLAEDPTRKATRERLRQLRRRNLVSRGVNVTKRDAGGLTGSGTCFSVLAALAAKSRHEGHDDDAGQLLSAASELEERFADQLREFLAKHSLDSLSQADFFDDLVGETAGMASWWAERSSALVAVAQVDDNSSALAHLAGRSATGEAADVDVPRKLLDRRSLVAGDYVWVFSRLAEGAAVVDVLRAVLVPCRGRAAADLAPALRRQRPEVGDDGLTADERAVYAQHWRDGVGADLTSEELASVREDARLGKLPMRRLRPAG